MLWLLWVVPALAFCAPLQSTPGVPAVGPVGRTGTTFCLNADGPGGRDAYELIESVFGTGSVESPDADHAPPFRHVSEAVDRQVRLGEQLRRPRAHLEVGERAGHGQLGGEELHRVPHPVALPGARVPSRRHVHSVVRTPNGNDYGKDLLRQHYEKHRHDAAHGHRH